MEDVDLIQEAVKKLPWEVDGTWTVVDLGAGSGTTALSVFDGHRDRQTSLDRFTENSQSLLVITIDHDPVALESTRQCMTNAGYVERWQGWLGTTSEKAWKGKPPVDMLMVDAGHEYEDVRADLEAWLPLVRDGAPVWCHDYTADYPGSMQAIDEAVRDGLLEPVKTAGWGWLGRKAAQV